MVVCTVGLSAAELRCLQFHPRGASHRRWRGVWQSAGLWHWKWTCTNPA